MTSLFVLLIVFQLKHFLADYPLQTPYMLGKFKEKGWVAPLAAHAAVHAWFTLVIGGLFCAFTKRSEFPVVWLLAAFDFVVHFTMDRIKASPRLMGRWKALSAKEYVELESGARSQATHYVRQDDGSWTNNHELILRSKLRGNTLFWRALGFDQLIHHLTHYAIIAALVLC